MEEQLDMVDPTYRGNIWCTPQERMDWRLYLTELGDDPKNHIEALDMIRTAESEDVIEILITSPGGYCSIADMYLAAMADSQAKIITRAIGECASAATTVFLAGDERVCEPGAYFMFHNVQFGGLGGDSANVFSRTKFYERLFKEKSYNQMAEVLNKEELDELFERAGEVYLTSEEMKARLANADRKADIIDRFGAGMLPPPMAICNRDTFGDSPRAVALRQQVNAPTLEAMEKAGFITLPFPEVKVKDAAEFPQGDEFDITLDDGFKKTFRLSTLGPRDFSEYNTDEIVEMGQVFGADLSGLPYYQAVDALIAEIKNGGGEQ
ncbi:prophage Clp protease-like protein [Pectobacterium phage POP15]|nr:prophage Clp protease-like protein [Pectobacterium phage POP15]